MKNIIKTILKVLLVVVILVVMSVAGVVGATFYKRWEADLKENDKLGGIVVDNEVIEEECFTCLFMGVNGHLTDFIMLGQYNPNTRDISLLSIPRDTNVSNSVDGKINSLYGGKYPEKVMKKVEERFVEYAKIYTDTKNPLLQPIWLQKRKDWMFGYRFFSIALMTR